MLSITSPKDGQTPRIFRCEPFVNHFHAPFFNRLGVGRLHSTRGKRCSFSLSLHGHQLMLRRLSQRANRRWAEPVWLASCWSKSCRTPQTDAGLPRVGPILAIPSDAFSHLVRTRSWCTICATWRRNLVALASRKPSTRRKRRSTTDRRHSVRRQACRSRNRYF